ncbi:MAG: MDR/zinc-dependent alcohol dehydrogenase-like family protein [Blastocatellia bacterium]
MKALRVSENGLKLSDVGIPEFADEAVVRVVKSGICNTDLEIVRGYAGFSGTIGHEFVGVVESSDTNPEIVGKRVVGEINVGCGKCKLCISGDSRHCPERTVLGIHGRDGAHAEFLTLPANNLLKVPASVSDDQAVFVEPLAAAFGITERADIQQGMNVAVIGDGKLGILCARALALKTDNTTLIGKHREKLDLPGNREIDCVLVEQAPGLKQAFGVVVEASGSESGFAMALNLVRPLGKIVLKSTFHGLPTWEAGRVVVDEITVVGSRCGMFAPAIQLLESRSVKVDDLISEQLPLARGVEAFRRAGTKGVLKVLLSMS